ncbi:MAG TPA: RNA 2',3'-cyclic phosphodiesterase [Caldimonas sp.]|jgi:2'-5' RNA ligase|nr:RNA 2',3'-cyclic phosphodiesterase [Caldimonas sp.]HEX2542768.1 RNA 2',3'-cyclic phosphodiesterase [Caldimonas sp.]
MARLFLGLWPDAVTRARLAGFRDAWTWPEGARPVPDDRLHLTLHFIGSFPREGIGALADRLAAVPPRATTLRARGPELWRGGVAVLRLEADAALADLHEELGASLSALGVPLDTRPFAPHVTLARKATRARRPLAPMELDWPADRFALVESIAGSNPAYHLLRVYEPSA